MLSKFVPRFGSSMTTTVTISGFVAVLCVTLALAGSSWLVLVDYVADGASRRQDANIRAAATILERDHPGTKVEWNADGRPRIVMGDIPAAITDHSTIDAVSRVTGDTTTLFGFDEATGEFVRRTTNVKKADGSRAVGTVLGKNGKVHPIVSRGETFTGTVDILGIPYVTTYAPVFSPAGKVIGIVYSGVKKSVVDAVIGSWTRSILLTGIVVLVLAGAAVLFFFPPLPPVRWSISPARSTACRAATSAPRCRIVIVPTRPVPWRVPPRRCAGPPSIVKPSPPPRTASTASVPPNSAASPPPSTPSAPPSPER